MSFIHETIREMSIINILNESFLDYGMSVITSRALPDVRDGLKPVHRRILYAMHDLGMTHDKPYKKSARIVGDVIGKYHPHGDSAVYETLVRMCQEWNMRDILIDMHGNNGGMEGDGAAAMRYTESRLTKLAGQLLLGLQHNAVDFQKNYDDTETEPAVLPARFPNLLVNGSEGIAVAMATKIPPHNLKETADAFIAFIDNPSISVDELMLHLKGPDFPTGASIMGTSGIKSAYETGKGSITVRAKVDVVTKKGVTKLVIRELPFQVNPEKLKEEIIGVQDDWKQYMKDLHKKNAKTKPKEKGRDFMVDKGLKDLRGQANEDWNVTIEIELKKDANPDMVLHHLYKHTSLQTTYAINNLALVPRKTASGETKLEPRVLTLKEIIAHYIEHQIEVVTRTIQFHLDKAEARSHRLEGIIRALDRLDETIAVIRAAKDPAEAKQGLFALLSITDIQAQAILEMRLHRLTSLDQDKQRAEFEALQAEMATYRTKLASEELILADIKADLRTIADTFGTDRRTAILPPAGAFNKEDLIEDEPAVVTITQNGFIKRTQESLYRTQRRKGIGVSAMTMYEDDFIRHLHVAKNKDTLLFFTSHGKVYDKKVYDIPESLARSRGQNIRILLNLDPDETVQAVLAIREFSDNQHLLFATKNGWVKKSKLSDYANIRQNGIIALTLKDRDRLIGVSLTNGERLVTLVTGRGKSITFEETSVTTIGRLGQGVKGISLDQGDEVVSFAVLEEGADLFIATSEGFGKRTPIEDFRVQHRGGKGVICLRPTDKNGKVIGSSVVQEEDTIMLMTKNGTLMKLLVVEISQMTRNTQGTKIIQLREGDDLTALARIPDEEHLSAP